VAGRWSCTTGGADPALTAFRTIRYFKDVRRAIGNAHRTDEFLRLFLAPGMHHCSGGPGPSSFDTLTALEQWVEAGIAPDMLLATHLPTGRTRPLCPYPQVARYTGSGSIDASNFACELRGLDRADEGADFGRLPAGTGCRRSSRVGGSVQGRQVAIALSLGRVR
jgi:feruloyl esterase